VIGRTQTLTLVLTLFCNHSYPRFVSRHNLTLTERRPFSCGTICAVYRGRHKNHSLAVKMPKNPRDIIAFKSVIREIDILRDLKHPNVVSFIGACFDSLRGPMLMIEEYKNGTLEDLLTQAQVKLKDDAHLQGSAVDRYICSGLTEELHDVSKLHAMGVDLPSMIQIGIEMMQCLAYLHSLTPPIMHRDIKPSNIFLNGKGGTKIGDFGFSTRVHSSEISSDGPVGTYRYMAPEIVLDSPYYLSADMYSAGVVLLYAFTGRQPYSGCTWGDVFYSASYGLHILNQYESG